MGWSPAQVGALENCGIKVEDATGDIQWREFETIDIIKPDPIQSPKSNIPFVGWAAAGFVTMFGADKGGDIGADLSTSYAGCDDVDIPHTK